MAFLNVFKTRMDSLTSSISKLTITDEEEYKEFLQKVYSDYLNHLKVIRLTYYVNKNYMDYIIRKYPTITTQKIMKDFETKYKQEVKEVHMSSAGHIVLLPR